MPILFEIKSVAIENLTEKTASGKTMYKGMLDDATVMMDALTRDLAMRVSKRMRAMFKPRKDGIGYTGSAAKDIYVRKSRAAVGAGKVIHAVRERPGSHLKYIRTGTRGGNTPGKAELKRWASFRGIQLRSYEEYTGGEAAITKQIRKVYGAGGRRNTGPIGSKFIKESTDEQIQKRFSRLYRAGQWKTENPDDQATFLMSQALYHHGTLQARDLPSGKGGRFFGASRWTRFYPKPRGYYDYPVHFRRIYIQWLNGLVKQHAIDGRKYFLDYITSLVGRGKRPTTTKSGAMGWMTRELRQDDLGG